MANTTVACTNINLLKESQIPASPSQTELYAVELDGKPATVDAGNFTATGKATIVGWGMPDYSTMIEVSYPFTAPEKGIAYVRTAGSGNDVIIVNNINIGAILGGGGIDSVFVKLDKGDILNVTGTVVAYIKFFELKGV